MTRTELLCAEPVNFLLTYIVYYLNYLLNNRGRGINPLPLCCIRLYKSGPIHSYSTSNYLPRKGTRAAFPFRPGHAARLFNPFKKGINGQGSAEREQPMSQ